MNTIEPVSILVGAALPLLGRRLSWVSVAGVSFLAGALVAGEVLAAESPGLVLGVALVARLVSISGCRRWHCNSAAVFLR